LENHGKSRKSANVENHGNHGKSRKITEPEIEVPIVCYCCSWLPRKITENHGNGNESSYCLLLLFLAPLDGIGMGKDLCEACVTMFCNGDVEERFAKWQ
jgi:hypothetical protein